MHGGVPPTTSTPNDDIRIHIGVGEYQVESLVPNINVKLLEVIN